MDHAMPNYFTCTLGQAAELKAHAQLLQAFSSVVELVDQQATRIPKFPALGFANTNVDTRNEKRMSLFLFKKKRVLIFHNIHST